MNLTKTNWPLGWVPSADPVNGSPDCLVRMDNLYQEELGSIALVKGMQRVGGAFPDYVDQIYSKIVEGNEHIWAALSFGRGIYRNGTLIAEGNERAAFGDAFGSVLITAGHTRVKDNGTTVRNLGLQTPGDPTVTAITQPSNQIRGSWFLNEGHAGTPNNPTGIDAQLAFDTLRGVVGVQLASAYDTTSIGDGPGIDPSTDIFEFDLTVDDGSIIEEVRLVAVLDDTYVNQLDGIDNYYQVAFAGSSINPGMQAKTTLAAKRGDFTRFGSDATLDWTHVTAFVFIIQALSAIEYTVENMQVLGGVAGQLNGTYTWKTVSVYDNGRYLEKSPASDATDQKLIINGYATITPGSASDASEIWYFRKSVTGVDVRGDETLLTKYYYVGKGDPGEPFEDRTSDEDALLLNTPLNEYLKSIQPLLDGNGLVDDIFSMEGIFYERMIYMTINSLILSDRNNPDAYDTRYTIKISGDPIERNLWIRRVTNNVLILATNKNLYEITGTLLDLPDGTLDIKVVPIGEAYPPISNDCFLIHGGGVAYVASDGVRITAGTNSYLISEQLNLLFQGQTRSEFPPVRIEVGPRYSIAAGKSHIYVSLPLQDGTRWLFVYHIPTKTWRVRYTDPVSVFVTQTDRVLLGFNLSRDSTTEGGMFELDKGNTITAADGTFIEGQHFELRTVFDANGQPRNRKDTFTLKIVADTGGRPVDIYLAKDKGSYIKVGSHSASGLTTSYFNLSTFTLGFRYSIKIVDQNLVSTFNLTELTIEYDARPEQLDYLRVLNNNLGSFARKRFTNYAFIIDTLGNNVSITPYVDNNSAGDALTINTSTKQTQIYYFTQETLGTDISCILSGGPFEFYGLNPEEIISEKLPTPVKFLVIPPNNYGTPNRKRHTSYKFQIDTRGADVLFTPILDGVNHTVGIINTSRKETVEYFFSLADGDNIGIDIGGTLASLADTPFEFYGPIIPQTIETLPDRLKYFRIPNTNLGSEGRKRITKFAFTIDTFGKNAVFIPYVDGIALTQSTVNTSGKTTYIHYFDSETIGTDFGGYIYSAEDYPFEYYGLDLSNITSEVMPTPCRYLVIPPNDFGSPNRKRHSSYKFVINTRGEDVTFTPVLDRKTYSSRVFNTSQKEVVEYFFDTSLGDIIGINIGGILDANTTTPFEFYGPVIPQKIETLPDRLQYYKIPNTNLGSVSRKRFTNYAFVIDTYGFPVTFTPLVDDSNGSLLPSSSTIITRGKETFIHYFTSETIGTDIGGFLTGDYPFEFYALDLSKIVSEDMPNPTKYLVIPANDYGVPNRKRHTSYKFQMNTRGGNVTFTPVLDGVSYAPTTFNNSRKTTCEYFFNPALGDIIGIDIGGILQSQSDTPFEFYGVITPQEIETLPPRLESFRIPNNNFGVAARKRVRTIPIIIDTYGRNVTFTPIVDGVSDSRITTLVSNGKTTLYHYFDIDSFGTDYGGFLSCPSGPFEFYGFGKPEDVEVLPVPKRYDQLGPVRFDKIGKIFEIRLRLIMTGSTTVLPLVIYGDDSPTGAGYNSPVLYQTNLTVTPLVDYVYQVQLPKSVNTDVFRLVLGPTTDAFHRYDVSIRMAPSGMETDSRWVPIR